MNNQTRYTHPVLVQQLSKQLKTVLDQAFEEEVVEEVEVSHY